MKSKEPKPPIDWPLVRERLGAAHAAFAGGDAPLSEKNRAILAERTRALARRPAAEAPTTEMLEVVAFDLGGQEFGLEGRHVREAIQPRELTRLPGVPPYVRGLVNVRSRVVPAFDLRPLLQLPATDHADEKMLIVAFDGTEFGLLVDRVVGLRNVSTASLRSNVPGLDARYLRGIAADGLLLLDLSLLFPDLAIDDGNDS